MTTNSNFRVKNGLEVAQNINLNGITLSNNSGTFEAQVITTVETTTTNITKALFHFNGDLLDSGPNGVTLTPTGETELATDVTKFGGGSLLIGTSITSGNYALIDETTALNFGLNDYTIEAWIYIPENINYNWSLVQINGVAFGVGSGPEIDKNVFYYSPAAGYHATSGSLTTDTWHLIALSRSNGNIYLSIDGVTELVTTGNADNIVWESNTKIGSDNYSTIDSIIGYVDEIRFSLGALYTGNFTPVDAEFTVENISNTTTATTTIDALHIPTTLSALTNDVGYITTSSVPTTLGAFTNDVGFFTNTNFAQVDIGTIKLRDDNGLLHAYTENVVTEQIFTGTQVFLYNFNSTLTDETGNTSLTPAGETEVVDTYTKFGGGSLFVGSTVGNSNYAAISEDISESFNIGTNDYTLEGWVYIPSGGGYNWGFMQLGTPIWGIQRGLNDARPSYWNGSTYLNTTIAIPPNEWAHISWSRKNGNLYASINGVVELIQTDNSDIQYNTNAMIGSDAYPNESFIGYIDSIRLVKGIALYTENFIVPSAEPSASDVFYITNTSVTQTSALVTATSQLINDSGFITSAPDTGDIRFDGTWIKNVDTGDIYISPQDGQTWVYLPSDSNASNSALSINNSAGDGIVSINADSQVTLTANSKQLALNNDGSITLPVNTAHITFDSANGDVVNLATSATVVLSDFSGEVLINDLYDGFVYKFLVGGGACNLVGHTNSVANTETITSGPAGSVGITNWVLMEFAGGGYTFTNLSSGTSDRNFSIVTIRTRASS